MTKLHYLVTVFFLLTVMVGSSQSYKLLYMGIDDSMAAEKTGLEDQFLSRSEASAYLSKLPFLLSAKGFVTASIDSLEMDSTSAKVHLFLGKQYTWESISVSRQEDEILSALSRDQKAFHQTMDFNALRSWQQKILDVLEDHGYPFAKVYLDSIELNNEKIMGFFK